MGHRPIILFSLGCLMFIQGAQAFLPRAHIQWSVAETSRKDLEKSHGVTKVYFTETGSPVLEGLDDAHKKRWLAFYKLCMSDGCTYCDYPTGSCEAQTCGPDNSYCKPHLADNGYPKCGMECAYYGLSRL